MPNGHHDLGGGYGSHFYEWDVDSGTYVLRHTRLQGSGSAHFGDLDGDGVSEYVHKRKHTAFMRVTATTADNTQTALPNISLVDSTAGAVDIQDFDGDGAGEILCRGPEEYLIYEYGTELPILQEPGKIACFNYTGGMLDTDDNGKPEIMTMSDDFSTITTWESTADNTFAVVGQGPNPSSSTWYLGTDMNNDARSELFAFNATRSRFTLYHRNGNSWETYVDSGDVLDPLLGQIAMWGDAPLEYVSGSGDNVLFTVAQGPAADGSYVLHIMSIAPSNQPPVAVANVPDEATANFLGFGGGLPDAKSLFKASRFGTAGLRCLLGVEGLRDGRWLVEWVANAASVMGHPTLDRERSGPREWDWHAGSGCALLTREPLRRAAKVIGQSGDGVQVGLHGPGPQSSQHQIPFHLPRQLGGVFAIFFEFECVMLDS